MLKLKKDWNSNMLVSIGKKIYGEYLGTQVAHDNAMNCCMMSVV